MKNGPALLIEQGFRDKRVFVTDLPLVFCETRFGSAEDRKVDVDEQLLVWPVGQCCVPGREDQPGDLIDGFRQDAGAMEHTLGEMRALFFIVRAVRRVDGIVKP